MYCKGYLKLFEGRTIQRANREERAQNRITRENPNSPFPNFRRCI